MKKIDSTFKKQIIHYFIGLLITLMFTNSEALALSSKEKSKSKNEKESSSLHFKRWKKRADRSFHAFRYIKAIDQYKVAYSRTRTSYISLQIANAYRLINDTKNSALWYENTLKNTVLKDQDMVNFGQVLAIERRYEDAHTILDDYTHHEDWVQKKSEGFKSIPNYYRNRVAFKVREASFNTTENDFSPMIIDSGIMIVSNRSHNSLIKTKYKWDNSLFLNLFHIDKNDNATKAHRNVSSRFHEGPATIFDNQSKMIFTRNNYLKKKYRLSADETHKLSLYITSKNKNGNWSKPASLPFSNTEYNVGHPSMSKDGVLYFASDQPGGYGNSDIYKVVYLNGEWGTPVNMGSEVNTEEDEMFPYIHNDSVLYFSSKGHHGLGGLDLYKINLSGEQNQLAKNLGYPMNTSKDDFGIVFKESNRAGYLSSNREGGTGKDDIYAFDMFQYKIKVNLVDSETGKKLNGNIISHEKYASKLEIVDEAKDIDNTSYNALRGSKYKVNGSAEGYEEKDLHINTKEHPIEETNIEVTISLEKNMIAEISKEAHIVFVENNKKLDQVFWGEDIINLQEHDGYHSEAALRNELTKNEYTIASEIKIKNILYDFDKYNIREDASVELDKLIGYMKGNEQIRVRLTSHTDIRGSVKYNDRLSNNRANSAKKYLIDNGIDSRRIEIEFKSELQPIVSCESNESCNTDQHQSNRRTDIILLTE